MTGFATELLFRLAGVSFSALGFYMILTRGLRITGRMRTEDEMFLPMCVLVAVGLVMYFALFMFSLVG